MFTTHPRRRSTRICALACAALMAALSSTAVARPAHEPYTPSSDSTPAQAQEVYYSSYDSPRPLFAPESSPSDTPWLAIAGSIAGVMLIVGAGATQVHRTRLRRRRTVGAAL